MKNKIKKFKTVLTDKEVKKLTPEELKQYNHYLLKLEIDEESIEETIARFNNLF